MIVTFLAILVNEVILAGLVGIINEIFPLHNEINSLLSFTGITFSQSESIILTSFSILVALILVSLSPVCDIFLRYSYGCRQPINSEKVKLEQLFNEVSKKAGKNVNQYSLFIVDEAFPNAYALGNNMVAVSRKLLTSFSDDEICGVLAHEIAHLHYGDTVKNRIFVTVSVVGQVVLLVYHLIASILRTIGILPLVGWVLVLFSYIFSIQAWLIQVLMIIPLTTGALFGSRQNEYRADKFAVDIGYGQGLNTFLLHILDIEMGNSNFLSVLQNSHPKTGNRIRKIEEMQKMQPKKEQIIGQEKTLMV